MLKTDFTRRAAAVIAALGIALSAGAAEAAKSKSAHVQGFTKNPIIVKSNGQDYVTPAGLGLGQLTVKLVIDAGAGRVKSWKVTPKIVHGYGIAAQVPGLNAYAMSESYPIGQRPKSINRSFWMNVPLAKLNQAAAAMCQFKKNSLLQQGKSKKQVFASDYNLHLNASVGASVKYTTIGKEITEASAPFKINVICKKWSGPQIPTPATSLDSKLQVVSATTKLTKIVTLGGTCQVKLITAIRANKPKATIKYRYVHSNGQKSKVFTTKTKANKIAVVTRKWNVPNKPGPEIGSFQLVGVSPGFKANSVGYRMNCRSGGPGGLAQKEPSRPQTRTLGGRPASTN